MRARLTVAAGTAALALAGSVFAASPALAACVGTSCSANTAVTFTLTGGALSISAQSSAVLTPGGALGTTSNSVSGSLGSTTVTDNRGGLANTATVTMTSTDFNISGGGASSLIPATGGTAYSGAPTGTTGTAVATPTLTGATNGNLAAGASIMTVASVGSGSVSYNPTVSVTLPANAVAGTYSGTVTQTLS